jgi:hypothetical protein
MKPLVLGGLINLAGDIATNTWVGARSAAALELISAMRRGACPPDGGFWC